MQYDTAEAEGRQDESMRSFRPAPNRSRFFREAEERNRKRRTRERREKEHDYRRHEWGLYPNECEPCKTHVTQAVNGLVRAFHITLGLAEDDAHIIPKGFRR